MIILNVIRVDLELFKLFKLFEVSGAVSLGKVNLVNHNF